MRLATTLKSKDEISDLIRRGVDVFVLETDCFTRHAQWPKTLIEIEEASEMLHALGKSVYLSINVMIHEQMLGPLKLYLQSLKDFFLDGVLIFDLTVSTIMQELGMNNLCVYNPGTMNTSTDEVAYLDSFSLKGITISKEITLEEILAITALPHHLEYSIVGHGYLEMFTSKRKLLTNYFLFKGWNLETLDHHRPYFLEEEMRDGLLSPIFEDSFGTTIFRPKKLFSKFAFDQLKDHVGIFFISRFLMDEEELFDALACYQGTLTEQTFLGKYRDSYDSGFFFKRTELKKGESK